MKSIKLEPKFNKKQNPKIGLIALASDYMIEKDFIKAITDNEMHPLLPGKVKVSAPQLHGNSGNKKHPGGTKHRKKKK